MANFREHSDTGTITAWHRARQMVLDNPVDEPPAVTVHFTEATRYPDGSVVERSLGTATHTMSDPAEPIPLIDPETFEPTEQTFPAGQFYLLAASVYRWLADQQEPTP